MMAHLKGPLFLAWSLFLFILSWPFRFLLGKVTTLSKWQLLLKKEHITPPPKQLWSYVDLTSRCIACGLCDVTAHADESPSAWIMGSVRYPKDAVLALAQAKRLRELAPEINRICPAHVPVEEVARLIEENAL